MKTEQTTQNAVIFTTQELLEHWQGHRKLTRKTIEAFPEDKLFTYSIGGMRPFAELVYEFLGMAEPGISGIATGKWEKWADAEKVTTKKNCWKFGIKQMKPSIAFGLQYHRNDGSNRM